MTESEAWTEIAQAFETPRVRNDDGIRAGGLCYAATSVFSTRRLPYSVYNKMRERLVAERLQAIEERGDAWDAFYWPKTQAGDKKRATLAALFAAEAAHEEEAAALQLAVV